MFQFPSMGLRGANKTFEATESLMFQFPSMGLRGANHGFSLSTVSIPINLYHEVAWDLGVPTIVDFWRTIGRIC